MKQLLLALGLSSALFTSVGAWADTAATASAPAATASASAPAATASAPAATPVAAPAAAPAAAPKIDSGNTAWMLASTALVLFMTIPGLALYYGGMVRRKNVLGTMMHSLTATAIVTVLWIVVGYSLAFGNSTGALVPYIGGFDKVLMSGIDINKVWTDAGGTANTISEYLFMIYQMTFAIITAALIAGSVAERMKYSAFVLFIALWTIVVYSPVCHWVWHAKGWLAAAGALDFAGGTVVHINSGIAGLVAAYLLGKRLGFGKEPMAPHNLTLTVMGAAMLWVGWFGFNAGSELAADGRATMAMVVTQVATAAAVLSWLAVEYLARGKASVLGGASGAIAGLVAITPASGYVAPGGALVIGLVAGVICFWGTTGLKRILKADDSLDAFGVHAVGGIAGALLTAVFATKMVTGTDPKPVLDQLIIQGEGIGATLIYSGVVSAILIKIVDVIVGIRIPEDGEREGMDVSQHGERVE